MEEKKTFREVALMWQEHKREYVKTSTYWAYVLTLEKHLLPEFGDLHEVDEESVQAFATEKARQGLSAKTIKGILIVLKMVMKYGDRHRWLIYRGWEVRLPSQTNDSKRLPVLSVADSKAIARYVSERFTYSGLGIYICLTTGMRIGEICGLTWGNVDVERGMIYVRQTMERLYVVEDGKRYTRLIVDSPKTASSIRDIPMGKDLANMLRPLKRNALPDNYVLSNSASPIEPRTYRNHFKRMLADLGIPALKFHGLRHSFATRCIESHCDYKTVSSILGHASISTTLNLYVHPNSEQKRKCINKVFKVIGK